jgi:hypothetical protein
MSQPSPALEACFVNEPWFESLSEAQEEGEGQGHYHPA